jgi:flavoprotein
MKKKLTKVTKTRPLLSKKLEAKITKIVLSDENKVFVMKNGKKLKSMYDLVKSLEKMSDDIFTHHVTPYKNDFCAWIYHAFGEVELARLLANEKNKKNTVLIIKEYYKD